MRILELRFKNLNSLYGEWAIDFTTPEYVVDGIFAITGPTGAGKSTILDAICLALYGRTPRLKSITKSGNEILSRQTGDCFAEVRFEVKDRQFRCHWSQRKARKKTDGNLIDSQHEIADAVTGKVLASKKRDVSKWVETETGMDFDRLTRSMLLAQGGFAAFLAAAPDDRSPILEQMTGTRIYSDISKGVHARWRDEAEKLRVLQAQMAEIGMLNDEQEADLVRELGLKQAGEKKEREKNEAARNAILWLTGMDTLKAELSDIDKEFRVLEHELKSFEKDREKLQAGLKAAELEKDHATLVSKRVRQEQDSKALAEAQGQVAGHEKQVTAADMELKTAEEAVVRAKDERKTELVLIKAVRDRDAVILQKTSQITTDQSACKKIETQVLKEKQAHKEARSNQAAALKDLSRTNAYLAANEPDAELVTELAGIREQFKALEGLSADISLQEHRRVRLKNASKKQANVFKKQESACQTLREAQTAARKNVERLKKKQAGLLNGRLLREYRDEQAGLFREMAYLRKIESLEQHRGELVDGKACPLCGALNHPFTEGSLPEIDETERKINRLADLIGKADHLENELKKGESKENEAAGAVADAEKLLVQAQHEQDTSLADIGRIGKELAVAVKQSSELKQSVLTRLGPFGIKTLPEKDLAGLSKDLGARQERWQSHMDRQAGIEKRLSESASTLKSLDAVLKTLDDSLMEKQDQVSIHQKDLETRMVERQRLYGDKQPDTEEARVEDQVTAAEKAERAARKKRDTTRQTMNDLKTRITALTDAIKTRGPELDDMTASFAGMCQAQGFETEAVFVLARLSMDRRKQLSQRAGNLDEKRNDLATRKKDREAKLIKQVSLKLTKEPLEALEIKKNQSMAALTAIGEEVGAIKQKLSDNTAAKARLKEKGAAIEAQKTEWARWDALHVLIGSADGKKYRNFAQGLTFEVMVAHANQQLERMSDRYLLIRDEKQPLELNIVDNYQAGEIRSTKNLSGGESFIVSLSLALGLSSMASRNVRVDSLFLDEGFGTLDEDALEVSLEALSGLHQKGKLIGVISHVSALKERISTQINIQPVSGGRSRITGPGCMQIEE